MPPIINVDFDVYKAITLRRPSEDVAENEVLRQLLGLPAKSQGSSPKGGPMPGDWVSKGVRFPQGTEFRGRHKGQTHLARVENGGLLLHGKRYDSPSAAAISVTGNPVNGWRFWEARLPGQGAWQTIDRLRAKTGD